MRVASAAVSYTRRVKLRLLSLAIMVTVGACLPETVELAYSLEEGRTVTYRMTARAEAQWDVGGPGRGSYEVSFDIEESVTTVDADGSVLVVEMVPIDAEENGLPSPGLERRTFSLRVGPEGDVLEVLQLDGIEASALDHDELAFIGTYRPPLPDEPVKLRDDWSDHRAIQLGSEIQEIDTTGTLVGFARAGESDLARVAFTGTSPLEWITNLPQGEAQLTGTATTEGTAMFDIAAGALDRATSSTRGDFEVRVIPGGGEAPIDGTLRLDLELLVERV